MAYNVILVEPSWNPEIEQSIGNEYYSTSQKTINIYKFITNETIEKRIFDIQKNKKNSKENKKLLSMEYTKKKYLQSLKEFEFFF